MCIAIYLEIISRLEGSSAKLFSFFFGPHADRGAY